ncbi:hypothetical protein ACHAW6_009204 [Cyclotella cf. meneghiniana]
MWVVCIMEMQLGFEGIDRFGIGGPLDVLNEIDVLETSHHDVDGVYVELALAQLRSVLKNS